MRLSTALFFSLLMLSFQQAISQDSLSRSFVSLSLGGSFASGKYGESRSNSEGSGFANGGFHYQIEVAGFWTRNTGFGAVAGGFSNSIDVNAFSKSFTAEYEVISPPPPGTKVSIANAESWKINYFMVGPYITLPMKNIMIDFKALGGMAIGKPPGLTMQKTTGSAITTQDVPSISDTGFGYLVGANFRLKLSARTQLKFSADYIHAYIEKNYQAVEIIFNSSRGIQSVTALNLSWGFAFTIGH